jgi:hypothetical protein
VNKQSIESRTEDASERNGKDDSTSLATRIAAMLMPPISSSGVWAPDLESFNEILNQ